MNTKMGDKYSMLNRNVCFLCFAALGALTARHVVTETELIIGAAFIGGLFALIGLYLLSLLIGVFVPHAGMPAAKSAVSSGFLLLLPFTVLALAAELMLHWNAVQAFTSAGIMTAGAAVGAEVAKQGGGRLASMAVPSLGALSLAGLWLVLSTLVVKLGGLS